MGSIINYIVRFCMNAVVLTILLLMFQWIAVERRIRLPVHQREVDGDWTLVPDM